MDSNPEPTPRRASRGIWQLQGAVVLFGLAGVLGKAVTAGALQVTFVRSALAAIVLCGVSYAFGRPVRRVKPLLGLSGGILALHWWTFFHAIKISSVAIGVLSFATFPVFVILLAPLNGLECWRWRNLLLATVAGLGVALLVPGSAVTARVPAGIAWGVFSAILFAQLSLLNRRLSRQFRAIEIGCWQNAVAALLLAVWSGPGLLSISGMDWMLLLVLGVLCTALAHLWYVRATISVPPILIGTTVALEPVYGILFAALWLHEYPEPLAYLGGALILITALTSTFRSGECRPGGDYA